MIKNKRPTTQEMIIQGASKAPEGILLLDAQSRITYCNDTLIAIFGLSTSPEGALFEEVFSPDKNKRNPLYQTTPSSEHFYLMIQEGAPHFFSTICLDQEQKNQIYICFISTLLLQQQNYTLACLTKETELPLSFSKYTTEDKTDLSKKYTTLLASHANLKLENTEKTAITQALRRAESRYRNIFDNASEGIFQWTTNGRLLWANITFAQMLGFDTVNYLLHYFATTPFSFIATEEKNKNFMLSLESYGDLMNYETLIKRCDGSTLWASINARRVRHHTGKTYYYEAFIENISIKKFAEEKLLYQAFHDPLTGLANRALFTDRLDATLRRAARQKQKFAVMFLDLDHFKQVNDTYGHNTGDLVLKHSAKQILTCVRDSDTVARFGGDEFGIILENTQDESTVMDVAERILFALNQPIPFNNNKIQIGSSIGIVLDAYEYTNIDTILSDADTAMYVAKSKKRSSIQVYDANIASAQNKKSPSAILFKKHFDNRDFFLEYQPIINPADESFLAFEALIRWKNKGVIVPPNEFLADIRDVGLAERLDFYVLELVCEQIKKWQKTSKKNFTVHINIASYEFMTPAFYQQVVCIIEKYKVSPHKICFEIAQSILPINGLVDLQLMKQYHNLGFKFCLEALASAFSSLSYLLNFPQEYAKLDRVFINGINSSKRSELISKSLFSLGKNLGIDFIAVGVENTNQVDLLQQAGCSVLQGFYFSPPLCATEIEKRLK